MTYEWSVIAEVDGTVCLLAHRILEDEAICISKRTAAVNYVGPSDMNVKPAQWTKGINAVKRGMKAMGIEA